MPERPYKATCHPCGWTGTEDETVDLVVPSGYEGVKPSKFNACPECGKVVYIHSPMPGPDAGQWADMLNKS